jgi:hypothetical protein
MEDSKNTALRVELTSHERKQTETSSGVELNPNDLNAHELEERVAPVSLSFTKVAVTYTPQ